MANPLFKPMSALMGWFFLMELATAIFIVAYWVEFFRHGPEPWENGAWGPSVTVLFIVSNALWFRHRRWAVAGFIACWLTMAMALLPTI
jgi:hypothetical protein